MEWNDALTVRGPVKVNNLGYNLRLWMEEPAQFEDHVRGASLSTWTGTITMKASDPDFGPEIRYQKVEEGRSS